MLLGMTEIVPKVVEVYLVHFGWILNGPSIDY